MTQEQSFGGAERRREHRTLLGLLGELAFLARWWPAILALPLPVRRYPLPNNGRRRRERGGRRATDRHVLGLELPPTGKSPMHAPAPCTAACTQGACGPHYRISVQRRPPHYPPRARRGSR